MNASPRAVAETTFRKRHSTKRWRRGMGDMFRPQLRNPGLAQQVQALANRLAKLTA